MADKLSRPIISVPVTLQRRESKRLMKQRAKELEAKHSKYYRGDRKSPALIQCRRQELNHYRGQVYSPFNRLPLATEHWMSRSTIGDFFSFVPFRGPSSTTWYKYAPNPMDSFQFADGENQQKIIGSVEKPSFKEYGFDERLSQTLPKIGMKIPTNIQFDSIPVLLSGKSGLIASETGNGKTLAFLLPTIQKILNSYEKKPELSNRKYMTPLAVIATPGRELAYQIKEVTEALCPNLNIEVKFATGSAVQSKIEGVRRGKVDILIGSVGGLSKMFSGKLYFSDFVDTIVLDEIDTMVDDSFSGVTGFLLAQLRKKSDQQFIFSGATYPTSLSTSIGHIIDTEDLEIIKTGHLHRVLPNVYQKFIKAPKTDRMDYLLDIIEPDVDKKRKVLIFCNKGSTSAFLNHYLNEKGIKTLHFAGGNMNPNHRKQNLEQFMVGDCNVLACTDLVSRGIDTQMVHHVVNYDFPASIVDYLHRVGRVGRVGQNINGSKVTNLVCGKISVALVQEIEKSVRLNRAIPDVESNVKSLYEKYAQIPTLVKPKDKRVKVSIDESSEID